MSCRNKDIGREIGGFDEYFNMKDRMDDFKNRVLGVFDSLQHVYNLVNYLMVNGDTIIDEKGSLQIVPGRQVVARFG